MLQSRRISSALIVLLLLLLPAATQASGRYPRAPGLPHNTLVALNRSEPGIAVNPRQPDNLLISTNATYDAASEHRHAPALFTSYDGGRHWQGQHLPLPSPFGTGADTSIGFDASGTAYIGLLAEDYNGFCQNVAGSTAIVMLRSGNGGRTLDPPVTVDIAPAGATDDKPLLAVEASGTRAGNHTRLALAWTRWLDAGGSAIVFSHSVDGGRTWSAPRRLFVSASTANMGAVPLFGPQGEIYVLWGHDRDRFLDSAPQPWRVFLRRSTDGGRSFGGTRGLPLSQSLPQLLTPGHLRLLPLPAAAVDSRTGTLYVAWARARPLPAAEKVTTLEPNETSTVDADIVLSRSTDRGATWSAPVVLNDTARGDRFQPALAVLPQGLVATLFYDRRADHGSFTTSLVLARDLGHSIIVGRTMPLTPIPSQPFRLSYFQRVGTCVEEGRFVGDYNGLAADPARGRVAAAWGDNQRGEWEQPDIRYSALVASVPAGTVHRFTWRLAP